MLAYVKLVQSREKELGCDVLTHQKWSGAGYIDGILGSIQSGSSGSKSMGEGNTESGKFVSLIKSSYSNADVTRILNILCKVTRNLKYQKLSPCDHVSV